jgi:hypothetical protein
MKRSSAVKLVAFIGVLAIVASAILPALSAIPF